MTKRLDQRRVGFVVHGRESAVFTLDLNSHHLRFGPRSIRLTKIEAKILAALMRWPEHVKSCSELLGLAWPDDTAALEVAVHERIAKIRKKARAAFGSFDAIRTIYGVGYIFEGEATVLQKSDNSETVTFPCEWVPSAFVDEENRRQWNCAVCPNIHLSAMEPYTCARAYNKYKIKRLADAKIRRQKMDDERIKDAAQS